MVALKKIWKEDILNSLITISSILFHMSVLVKGMLGKNKELTTEFWHKLVC